jgi:hypothetical protein
MIRRGLVMGKKYGWIVTSKNNNNNPPVLPYLDSTLEAPSLVLLYRFRRRIIIRKIAA